MSGFACLITHMPSWCGQLQFHLILNHLETDTACFECGIVYKERLIFTLQSSFMTYGKNALCKDHLRAYVPTSGRPSVRPSVRDPSISYSSVCPIFVKLLTEVLYKSCHVSIVFVKIGVVKKQSHYRPGQAQRFPGS